MHARQPQLYDTLFIACQVRTTWASMKTMLSYDLARGLDHAAVADARPRRSGMCMVDSGEILHKCQMYGYMYMSCHVISC